MRKLILASIFFYFTISSCVMANVAEFAEDIPEAQTLVEARDYLKEVRDLLAQGKLLPKRELIELEEVLREVAQYGCYCPGKNHIIRAQAYALIGTINGVIAKETKSIGYGRRSYDNLAHARELDSRNVDAIRGQGEALRAILTQGFFARNLVSMTLGIELKKATREIIVDLRTFIGIPILLRLADQLERLL